MKKHLLNTAIIFCGFLLFNCSGSEDKAEPEMQFRTPDLSLLSEPTELVESGIIMRPPLNWRKVEEIQFHVEQLLESQPSMEYLATFESESGDEQLIAGYSNISADSLKNWMRESSELIKGSGVEEAVVFDVFRHNELGMANLLFLGRDSVFLMVMAQNGKKEYNPAVLFFILGRETYNKELLTVESVLATLQPFD